MAITTYVYCHDKKKMVEKGTEVGKYEASGAPMIIPPMKPFVSPITGETIRDRAHLARHNKANGVTNSQDYSTEWMERKAAERERIANGDTPQDRAERIEIIKQAMNGSR